MAREGLTGKQRVFVEAYLGEAFFNATEAARIAGFTHPNKQGPRLLVNVGIRAEIKGRIDEAAMSANEVLARLSKQARASLFDLLTEEGEFNLKDARVRGVDDLMKKLKVKKRVIPVRGKDEEGNSLPSEVEYEYEYEIHDPQAALVHLGKFHKLFVDKVEHSNPDGTGLMQPVADAIERAYGDGPSKTE